MQIARTSVCCQIRNSTPFLSLPGLPLVDVLDVLCLRARCLQAMSNFKFWTFFDFPRTPPMHLIRVPKNDWRLSYIFRHMGVPHPPLNPSNYAKNMPTSRKFQKQLHGWQFFARPHSFGRSARLKPATFFQNSLSMSRIICTTSQCSRMSRNALKNRVMFL